MGQIIARLHVEKLGILGAQLLHDRLTLKTVEERRWLAQANF